MKTKIFYGFINESFTDVEDFIRAENILAKDINIETTAMTDGNIHYVAIVRYEEV